MTKKWYAALIPPVGLALMISADAAPHVVAPSPVRDTLPWTEPPLPGTKLPSRGIALEIRDFALGQCVLPPSALDRIARDATEAARLTRGGLRAVAVGAGGADGTPIRGSLNDKCAALAPRPDDENSRLAVSRAVQVKQHFMTTFVEAGGDLARLTWADGPPVITANYNQPYDRNAIVRLTWRSDATPSASLSRQARTR
jgi:hypothetical protein